MKSIEARRIPIEPGQRKALEEMLGTAGFQVLREIVSAHCNEQGIAFMDAMLYENETAQDAAEKARYGARHFNIALDVLDFIQQTPQEWYRVTLDQRH